MPDWYVQRNSDGPFPYQVRLGGCEYSLTEVEFDELVNAFAAVKHGHFSCVESEDYKHINYSGPDKIDLRKLIKALDETPMRRI